MNWNYLLVNLFGLFLFGLFVLTLTYYVNFHLSRRARAKAGIGADPIHGRYFDRFVPYDLRQKYEALVKSSLVESNRSFVTWKWAINSTLVACATLGAGFHIFQRWDQFLSPIELTDEEVSKIDKSHFHWQTLTNRHWPQWDRIGSMLKDKEIIFLQDRGDLEIVSQQSKEAPADVGRKSWQKWVEAQGFKNRICSWPNLRKCLEAKETAIYVILPGSWDQKDLDTLLNQGAQVLLFGSPTQLLKGETKWSYQDLEFESYRHYVDREIVLRGDQPLTLGFDAGQILPFKAYQNEYRVKCKEPQAMSLFSRTEISGNFECRWYSYRRGEGRLVWTDASPLHEEHYPSTQRDQLQAFYAASFRYLLRQPYDGIAMWPSGYKMGALLTYDLSSQIQNITRMEKWLIQEKIPVSLFVVGQEIQNHRSLGRRLSKLGEVGCLGDTYQVFYTGTLWEQSVRISLCTKIISELTGVKPQGLRPPEEILNGETIDAISNAGYNYYLAKTYDDRMVPILEKASGYNKYIVAIPRMVKDDAYFWNLQRMQNLEIKIKSQEERERMKLLGGVYTLTLHSHLIDSNDRERLTKDLILPLKDQEVYFVSAAQMANWWLLREQFLNRNSKRELSSEQKLGIRKWIVNRSGEMTYEDY